MNGTLVKNQLIFDYASGSLGFSKSVFASTYLYLNSKASNINSTFEAMLGEDLLNNDNIPVTKLKYTDCLKNEKNDTNEIYADVSPISKLVGPLNQIKWKQVYKGFKEFTPKVSDENELKLIKMDPGASVPLHSHGGQEYILVLNGSFCDEYGKYNKGDMQINDQKIKHTPIACKDEGCICLTITEKEVIFFGRFGSFLNLFTFIKSFFK
jgi:putative transcriptional regulator